MPSPRGKAPKGLSTLESSRRAPGGGPWRTPGGTGNAPRSAGSRSHVGQSQDARLCAQEGNGARIASVGEFEIIGTSNPGHLEYPQLPFFP